MNEAKKLLKNQGVNEKKSGVLAMWSKEKILVASGIIIALIAIVAICYSEFKPKLIVTINDQRYHLSDVMYDIYSQEQTGNSMSSFYQQLYRTSYWEAQANEDGDTGAEVAKDAVMESVEQREVLYQLATQNGYALTEEEEKSVADKVKTMIEGFTDKQKKISGLDTESLTAILKKDTLASRYKQNVIDGFNIDDAAITASISKKDYRQYDLQYYYVSNKNTAEDGKTTDKTAEEKANLLKQMKDLKTKAATAQDFTKLLAEDDKSGIEYKTEKLIETDEDFLTAKLRKQIKKMKNGNITDVIEAEDGYYLIRMENNNSTEAYDTAVKDAITEEETTQFDDTYADMLQEFEITENDDEWDRVKMGQVTL